MKSAEEIKITKELQVNKLKSNLPAPGADGKFIALQELNDEGFPDFMVSAFLDTAKRTKTIVSSRLPGGEGTGFIEAGYDLKGFQIKAKSCNWGPMGGFICQLPFFNKSGFDKVGYNTGHLVKYLAALESFTGPGEKIAAIESIISTLRPKLSIASRDEVGTVEKLQGKLNEVKDCLGFIYFDLDNPTVNPDLIFVNKLCEHGPAAEEFKKQQEKYTEQAVRNIENDATLTALQKAANLDLIHPGYNTFLLVKNKILKFYDNKLNGIGKRYKEEENSSAIWSGQNSIPANSSPFIPLVRQYVGSIDDVKRMIEKTKGTESGSVSTNDGNIIGTAYNKITEDGNTDIANSTIKMEYLLKQVKNTNLWEVYHGDIFYRSDTKSDFTPYDFSITPTKKNGVMQRLGVKPIHNEIGDRTAKEFKDFIEQEERKYQSKLVFIEQIFKRSEVPAVSINIANSTKTYYPVCGIMNPHPPYPVRIENPAKANDSSKQNFIYNPEFYKNAVSGDFDLFAFWPEATLPKADWKITRLSEIRLNQNLKLFTNPSHLFGLDFIPGFKELEAGGLKESAELGNISGLGKSVAVWVNVFAETAHRDIYGSSIQANKVFHSDEGGRPGIVEVEFPIAIFFPEKIRSKALNNLGKARQKMADRGYIDTAGGLIKNVEELLQLIIDINFTKTENNNHTYKIMMHSEWMIHLFYISLPKEKRTELIEKNVLYFGSDSTKNELMGLAADTIEEKMKEYINIDKHHDAAFVSADKPTTFDLSQFVENLKIVLRGEPEEDEGKKQEKPYKLLDNDTFEALRLQFLKFAFLGGRKAIAKKMDVEQVLYDKYLNPPAPAQQPPVSPLPAN